MPFAGNVEALPAIGSSDHFPGPRGSRKLSDSDEDVKFDVATSSMECVDMHCERCCEVSTIDDLGSSALYMHYKNSINCAVQNPKLGFQSNHIFSTGALRCLLGYVR